jgi:mRNA interferase MazF
MKQFEIFEVELNPAVGAEIQKRRPCLIISPNAMNKHLNTVIVAPLTHTIKGYPSRVFCNLNNQPGEIVLDQIRAVDKIRLKNKRGSLDEPTAVKVKAILQTMFS